MIRWSRTHDPLRSLVPDPADFFSSLLGLRLRVRIPPSPIRAHYVRATVRVHEYPDGSLAVYHAPHRLADYSAAGTLIEPDQSKNEADNSCATNTGHLYVSPTDAL